MKNLLFTVNTRIKKVKKAFENKEENDQISARTAKLITDAGTGKLTPSQILSKSMALYLRRQHHVHGDDAYHDILDKIMAFLSETGDFEKLYGRQLTKSKQRLTSNETVNHAIVTGYKHRGIYGVIVVIENAYYKYSFQGKASKILEAGKLLKTKLGENGIRSDFAKIALQLDQSESTYRGACWSLLNDNNAKEALKLFAYLYYYYKENPELDTTYYKALQQAIEKQFDQKSIEQQIADYQPHYNKQKQANVINTYQNSFSLINKDKQDKDFVSVLREVGAKGLIDMFEQDERFDNLLKATLALRAAKAARIYEQSSPTAFKADTLTLADYAYERDKSEGTLRNAYFAYQRIHQYDKAAKTLKLLKAFAGDKPSQKQKNLIWSAPNHLVTIIDKLPKKRETPAYIPIVGKVCYVIHNSLPYSSGGYATRGHGLLTALKKEGMDIYALTRPGYPHDISQIKISDIAELDQIDGVIYKRLLEPSRRDYSNYEYMLKAVDSYEQAFIKDKPELIIAASNHLDGLPAMFAARKLGIPFIYEVRGFWEITRLSKYPEFANNPMFEVEKKLEAFVATYADYIFTLTQGMIDELEERGVNTKHRVTLLPNSCNIERFTPTNLKDVDFSLKLNIPTDIPVIGYVGTLVSYEGLDDLAIACGRLKQQGYEFRLLIVGNENATGKGRGEITKQIESIATEYEFKEWLIMPGRVPFKDVERYYSLIDIAPFPRKAWPVCEIVPPMKTLEALAMQKAVIVSSNQALIEMIEHNVNGRVFERGNTNDLVNQLKYMLDNSDKWAEYGLAGREFIKNERAWQHTAQKAKQAIKNYLTTKIT